MPDIDKKKLPVVVYRDGVHVFQSGNSENQHVLTGGLPVVLHIDHVATGQLHDTGQSADFRVYSTPQSIYVGVFFPESDGSDIGGSCKISFTLANRSSDWSRFDASAGNFMAYIYPIDFGIGFVDFQQEQASSLYGYLANSSYLLNVGGIKFNPVAGGYMNNDRARSQMPRVLIGGINDYYPDFFGVMDPDSLMGGAYPSVYGEHGRLAYYRDRIGPENSFSVSGDSLTFPIVPLNKYVQSAHAGTLASPTPGSNMYDLGNYFNDGVSACFLAPHKDQLPMDADMAREPNNLKAITSVDVNSEIEDPVIDGCLGFESVFFVPQFMGTVNQIYITVETDTGFYFRFPYCILRIQTSSSGPWIIIDF